MSNRGTIIDSTYTDRVLQGNDRVYRWKYTLTREQASVNFRLMLIITAVIVTVICAVLITIFAADSILFKSTADAGIVVEAGKSGSSGLLQYLWIIPLIYLMIVGLPALIGYLSLGNQVRKYEMDDSCIRHKEALKGGGDAIITFEKIKWAEETGTTIRIKEGITTYTVYVPVEDADFVKGYMRAIMHCGFREPGKPLP